MKIALIDDGIEPLLCPNLLTEYDLCVRKDGRIEKRTNKDIILTGHGTSSAEIICKYAPTAQLCSLQVFTTEKLQTSLKQFLAALEWCYHHRIPVIHMSLGSTLWMDWEPLRRKTAKLLKNGQFLIAAHSNSGAYTAPACFMGVLGVAAETTYIGDTYCVKDEAEKNQIQIYASARHELFAGQGHSYMTQRSNSYATPLITAKAHNLLGDESDGNWTISKLYCCLAGKKVNPFRLKPDFLDEVILFCGSDKEVWEELFFFCVSERTDCIKICKAAVSRNPYVPVVILPSQNMEVNREILRFCKETCRNGFLYAGNGNEVVPDMESTAALFWDEKQYCNCVHRKIMTSESRFLDDTAKLLLEGSNTTVLLTAKKIQQEFEANGYSSMIVTDYANAYLYGMEYLPDGEEVESFAKSMAELRQASVVIYCLKTREIPRHMMEYDFVITTGQKLTMTMEKEQIFLPEKPGHEWIEKLLEYILEYEADE